MDIVGPPATAASVSDSRGGGATSGKARPPPSFRSLAAMGSEATSQAAD